MCMEARMHWRPLAPVASDELEENEDDVRASTTACASKMKGKGTILNHASTAAAASHAL